MSNEIESKELFGVGKLKPRGSSRVGSDHTAESAIRCHDTPNHGGPKQGPPRGPEHMATNFIHIRPQHGNISGGTLFSLEK
jgi:hypothetical protein